ncbi:hypothetical protein ABZW30_44220 [Kitasatospora sp. NPDC004669]|uniref:hypothetical protein n=1 Tax=Kitasatospora sp. NPDC004669 TaxID=3154555 RepID=UPI0033B97A34
MSVYVGIDVHRKRSQIAVVDQDGEVQVNRNVPNGVETVLGVIGDLPIGTPVAFEAAYGWGCTDPIGVSSSPSFGVTLHHRLSTALNAVAESPGALFQRALTVAGLGRR